MRSYFDDACFFEILIFYVLVSVFYWLGVTPWNNVFMSYISFTSCGLMSFWFFGWLWISRKER